MTATKRKPRKPEPPPADALTLTREQAAYLLQVSVETVDAMVAAGKIPTARLPTRVRRFSRVEVEEWIRKGCPRPPRR